MTRVRPIPMGAVVAAFALTLLTNSALAASASDLEGEVLAGRAGLHRYDGLQFVDGEGAFAGTKVAVVSRDPATGSTAMYMKLEPSMGPWSFHYHPGTIHTVVLEGEIRSVIGGREYSLGPGGYFRAPGGMEHAETQGPLPTMLFMITEGEFSTVATNAPPRPGGAIVAENVLWGSPGLHKLDSASWEPGTGALAGAEVAVVGADPVTGRTAMFMRLPKFVAPEGTPAHYHTSTLHNLVLEGAVSSVVDGERFTLGEGGYFRAPGGLEHLESEVPVERVVLFVLSEGEFGTVEVPGPAQASK